MFAVIFFVEPKPECWDDYLAQAAVLRPHLERVDGFLDNRRFTSQRHPGRLLSLSFWRDEKAIVQWRGNASHQNAQRLGRVSIFRDYRLHVGEVLRDEPGSMPRSTGSAAAISLIDDPATEPPPDAMDWDILDGITVAGSRLMVLFWPDVSMMTSHSARVDERRTDVRILRRYGLTDRREAPQHHDPIDQGH